MSSHNTRNPDADFVLHGEKKLIRLRQDDLPHALPKTNFKVQHHKSSTDRSKMTTPSIMDLERSINDLKTELCDLNRSLAENYEKSKIFLADDFENVAEGSNMSEDEDSNLHYLLQRQDEEAVSHLANRNSSWFSDPKHKTKELGDFPTYQNMGGSKRSVSPTNRGVGRFGAEIATKDVDGNLRPRDLASNEATFPVRLTAPHIVGVRSLLPPKHKVRPQNRERSLSPRSRPIEPEILLSSSMKKLIGSGKRSSPARDPSPLPVWMPTSKNPNASGQNPPEFRKTRSRTPNRRRPMSAPANQRQHRQNLSSTEQHRHNKYQRPVVQPLPGTTELSFMRSADQIDTRRALVENSPYQQQLAKLRLERLRVEEDYLLQLKRESELERIRGPKPKWYEMKGPEFHYECNKNTTLHKNYPYWSETMAYRDHLLETSREFASNMRSPVPALE